MASASTCSHCGKQREGLKKCSVCKKAAYCGAECQKAAWKKHKKTCPPPPSRDDVIGKINASRATKDWAGVLKWEGRLEELLQGQPDAACDAILSVFAEAHSMASTPMGNACNAGMQSTGTEHALCAITLNERRVDLLGKMGRFRDQGKRICDLADRLLLLGKKEEALTQFERAEQLGAAHGFSSVECQACEGIGLLTVKEGGDAEGVELLAAVPPIEEEGGVFSASADKELRQEIKRLTKKNTKLNRAVLHESKEMDDTREETHPNPRHLSLTFLRTVTEMVYDEDGQVEVVDEPLHSVAGEEKEVREEIPAANGGAVGKLSRVPRPTGGILRETEPLVDGNRREPQEHATR